VTGVTIPLRVRGLSKAVGMLSVAVSGVALAGDTGEPAYMEISRVVPLGLELRVETHCEKVKPLKRVSGEDPKWSLTAAPDGAVQVRCFVLKDGTVRQCRMSGPPALEKVVLDAVKQWKFEPYREKGQAAAVTYLFTLYWGHERSPGKPALAYDPSTRMDGWGSCLLAEEKVLANTPARR
jgi:TonB family protein